MKKSITALLAIFICAFSSLNAQLVQPSIIFNEDPGTHNMHICSDGDYLYTVNGGIANDGKISKFDMDGNLIQEYPVQLDMRSIMYCKQDKSFYVNSYDKNVYKIIDLNSGSYSIKFKEFYDNDQAGLALDSKGKYLYYLNLGTLKVYDFENGNLLNTYYGIKCGESSFDGGAAIAAGKKNFYTWDAASQEVYVYDKKFRLINSVKLSAGDYGFSLSGTKKYLFVATDGDYNTGTWYGYKLKDLY